MKGVRVVIVICSVLGNVGEMAHGRWQEESLCLSFLLHEPMILLTVLDFGLFQQFVKGRVVFAGE